MIRRRATDAGVLPPPLAAGYLDGALGRMLLKPWFDQAALWYITTRYLPLSRAWAAATLADGDPVRFQEELGWRKPPKLRWRLALEEVARRRAAYDKVLLRWDAAFYAKTPPQPETLVDAELTRQQLATYYALSRAAFMGINSRVEPLLWRVPEPEEVMQRHGQRLADPDGAYTPGPLPRVEVSHAVPSTLGREYFIRFPSPVLGDLARARVLEPAPDAERTVIFLHGILMEEEMWPQRDDPSHALVREGVRVIRIEGPWHNRRCLPGICPADPVIGRGPLGLIELFQAWLAEVAVVIAWARGLGSTRVATASVSLGSLTNQLILSHSRHWPQACRPDAGLLIATSGELMNLAYRGALTRRLGLKRRMEQAGWREREVETWKPLLEPGDLPEELRGKVVMVLGQADVITPYTGGRRLARRWGVTGDKLHIYPRGHFSASLSVLVDSGPIDQLKALLSD
ncbi:MAG: hypothetical protein WD489_01870 [Rhodovibrionaceae bacterium]